MLNTTPLLQWMWLVIEISNSAGQYVCTSSLPTFLHQHKIVMFTSRYALLARGWRTHNLNCCGHRMVQTMSIEKPKVSMTHDRRDSGTRWGGGRRSGEHEETIPHAV